MTKELVSLLQSMNRCLERFLEDSLQFLDSAEHGDFAGLESLQEKRDATLKAFDLYDRKVTETLSSMPDQEKTAELIAEVKKMLAFREGMIERIMIADQRIMIRIEDEMERVGRELAASRKAGAIMSKFRSQWVGESGEGIDQKL